MGTNATHIEVAERLAQAFQQGGNLLSFNARKVGLKRAGKVYDNDVVRVVLWAGYHYRDLAQRSLQEIQSLLDRGGFVSRVAREALKEHPGVSLSMVCEALMETQAVLTRAANKEVVVSRGRGAPRSFWSPLWVRDTRVPGAWVYIGGPSADPKGPIPGSIFLQGIKLGEIVVEPAPNGSWQAEHAPKTVIRKRILSRVPCGLFVQYRMDPKDVWDIRSGERIDREVPLDVNALRDVIRIG
jgi:hypothetical protein